tara:strand:- start:784 stop:1020 length:237 start_codon:yes stop_codon:yes gene_type:complete
MTTPKKPNSMISMAADPAQAKDFALLCAYLDISHVLCAHENSDLDSMDLKALEDTLIDIRAVYQGTAPLTHQRDKNKQ